MAAGLDCEYALKIQYFLIYTFSGCIPYRILCFWVGVLGFIQWNMYIWKDIKYWVFLSIPFKS